MADAIGDQRDVLLNGKPVTRKRGRVSVAFRQPPPVVDIDLGWGRYQSISMEEAKKMHEQLTEILRSQP
jgi:hypothetical protein